MRKLILTTWLGLLAVPLAQAADPPAIVQIRNNYNLVNEKIKQATYKAQSKDVHYCGDSVSTYTRWMDERGVMRRLTEDSSSDATVSSSDMLTSLWFDSAGRLDFALLQATEYEYDVHTDNNGKIIDNGLKSKKETMEMRVYFDNNGKVIRTLNRFSMPASDVNRQIAEVRKLAKLRWSDLKDGCE